MPAGDGWASTRSTSDQLHFFNRFVPIERQVAGLRTLQREGTVHEVGVSMFELAEWQDAEAALGGPILTNQVIFNLAAPYASTELIPWAAAHDRVVIAASPLAMGLLSCRYHAGRQPTDLRRRSAVFRPENLAAAQSLFDAIRAVAARLDATPARRSLLAWVIHHPNVVAIPGASSVAQLEQNAAAADLVLTEDDMGRLSEAASEFHPVTPPYTKWTHLAAIGRELVA